jgi:hypothetical protein
MLARSPARIPLAASRGQERSKLAYESDTSLDTSPRPIRRSRRVRTDSPLEGNGFENSVPRCLATANRVGAFISASEWRLLERQKQLYRLAEADDRSGDSTAPTLIGLNPTEASKRLPIRRGTEISNPFPSSGESRELSYRAESSRMRPRASKPAWLELPSCAESIISGEAVLTPGFTSSGGSPPRERFRSLDRAYTDRA